MTAMLLSSLWLGPVLAAALAVPAPAETWLQDGYGAGHTFYNPGESVVNAATVHSLKTRWVVTPAPDADSCPLDPVAPIVADGRMFVLEPAGNQVGAYDSATGRKLWTSAIGTLEATGLAVSGDAVYVTDMACGSRGNDDSNVIALDAGTGEQRWNRLWGYTTVTFVLTHGVLIASGYCDVCEESAAYQVRAWTLAGGEEVWTRTGMTLAGPVASRDGVVLLSSPSRQRTEAVRAVDGRLRWGTGLSYEAAAADPVRNQFYVMSRAGLRALGTTTGRTVWTVRNEAGELATDGRRVYVASAGRVSAYQAAQGRRSWTRVLRAPGNPVRAGGLLYVTSGRRLMILAPGSGAGVRTFGNATGHVVAAGGRLFVTNGRTIKAFAP